MSTQRYWAEVHVRTTAGDLLTYYGKAGTNPSEARRSAEAVALAENPGGRVEGYRVTRD
ncbi:hypothetical protein [Kitasatospora sp. NPDC059160]|uniref:hypothetical protein n=1 Tax=Kitasatospora sp. NPDC059160 TaxID=3346748 RepID=UPI0036A07FB6